MAGESESWSVRFVGGPYHNQVMPVRRRLTFVNFIPYYSWESLGPQTIERYELCKFMSEGGAPYWQFVCQTLIQNGRPIASCHKEALPDYLDARTVETFELQMRACYVSLRVRHPSGNL